MCVCGGGGGVTGEHEQEDSSGNIFFWGKMGTASGDIIQITSLWSASASPWDYPAALSLSQLEIFYVLTCAAATLITLQGAPPADWPRLAPGDIPCHQYEPL